MNKLAISFLMVPVVVWAGSAVVIDKKPSGSSGNVLIRCNVSKKVSLTISDTGANDLVDPAGIIDFGDVDADGTAGKVPGTPLGDRATYVANFQFTATRTGNGNVTLTAERSVAGSFNNTDGVMIDDNGGNLQNLAGTGGAVTVVSNQAEGNFTKRIGITVHSEDSGTLTSTVRFTLSAL